MQGEKGKRGVEKREKEDTEKVRESVIPGTRMGGR